ncbi:MAG: class IV adenylate cyclase [Nitrososphaerales archaeon]
MTGRNEFAKTLVELKVKVEDLNAIRDRVQRLNPKNVGVFKQIDTYYGVKDLRLKVRETGDQSEVQVMYYKRENIEGPKRSDILIFEAKPATAVKDVLASVLGIRIVVEKKREIYRYKGTQIHLDRVKGLGSYVEFERPTKGDGASMHRDQKVLEELFTKLGLDSKRLEKGSYSDLIEGLESTFIAIVFRNDDDRKRGFKVLHRISSITERVVTREGREEVWTIINKEQLKELRKHKDVRFEVPIDSLKSPLFRIENDGSITPVKEVVLSRRIL